VRDIAEATVVVAGNHALEELALVKQMLRLRPSTRVVKPEWLARCDNEDRMVPPGECLFEVSSA
jgi:hypothetical protein